MEYHLVIFNIFILLPLFLPGVILACTTLMSGGIYTADCTGRGMMEIPLGLPHDIKALDFKNNSLTKLFDNMFLDFKDLHHLYLSFNEISRIEHEAFFGIRNLISLDLEGNKLNVVPYDVFHDFTSLVHLNLNRNPLKLIQDYAFPGLPALEVLTLEHCQIDTIKKRAFLGLNQLKELSLAYNELTTLSSEVHSTLNSHSLEVLKLWGNPWHCDCNIRWIKIWLKMAQDDITWWVGDRVPTCVSPHQMERREWPNLQIDHFACTPIIGTSTAIVNSFSGTNVSLTCEIYAKPKGTAKWYKGTKLLEEQKLYHIVNMYGNDYNFTTTLKLYNVNINDSGQYYCMGTNYAGQSEASIEVLVMKRTRKPQLDFIYFDIGTIVGVILAAVIIIALIVIACYVCVQRRNKKKKKKLKKAEKLKTASIERDIVYTSNTKTDLFEEDDGPTCTVKINNSTYYSDPYRFPEEGDEEKTHIFSNQQHRQWQGSLGVHNPTASPCSPSGSDNIRSNPSGSDTIRSNRSGTDTIRSNRSGTNTVHSDRSGTNTIHSDRSAPEMVRSNRSAPETMRSNRSQADTVRSNRSNHRPIPPKIPETDTGYHDNRSPTSNTVPRSTFKPERPFSSTGYTESGYLTSSTVPALSPAESYQSSTYTPTTDTQNLNLDDDPYYYGTIV
ncbi:leucine-rich repeat-containing protein 24-like [Lineus longissimus]|uniref:leucine-rich repeat-containing protein 24-like n=1 Tax=Lineus longissimus TaxID=88925 RepID=UPI00315DA80F